MIELVVSSTILYLQSNDKMEIMSKLHSEEHIASELATRLEQQEDDIKDVRQQVYQMWNSQRGDVESVLDLFYMYYLKFI